MNLALSGSAQPKPFTAGLVLEICFVVGIATGLLNCGFFFVHNHYLPPPFTYDTSDTFMDWFNTAYYAVNGGIYDGWGSIYPPISFDFLKLFSIGSCYVGDAASGRDCDWLARGTLFSFFILNIWLVFQIYRSVHRPSALIRTFALCAGLPMLFTLERGNLIVPCFTAFILGQSRLLKSARLKWLATAISVNFKPYLIFATIPLLMKRRWRWLEGAAVMSVVVYALSYAALQTGSPLDILPNMLAFYDYGGAGYYGTLYYGASYKSVLEYFETGIPLVAFVGSRPLEALQFGIPLVVRLGQLCGLAAIAATAFKPNAVSAARLAAIGMMLVLTTTEFGGYTEVFILFLVFQERWRGVCIGVALISAYVLSVTYDVSLASVSRDANYSYLGHRLVEPNRPIDVGMLVRPGLILILELALSIATLIDVFRQFRTDARLNSTPPPTATMSGSVSASAAPRP